MHSPFCFPTAPLAVACLFACALCGCHHIEPAHFQTPAASGLNTRDLIDPAAQAEADALTPADQLAASGERLRKDRQEKFSDQSKKEGGVGATQPGRNILCLSGGGSYGAYTTGVLLGWSQRGDRPCFDVVTGISTGALDRPGRLPGAEI